jgi:uncharacterized protein YdhG (YjbR/CyaY superfamily)
MFISADDYFNGLVEDRRNALKKIRRAIFHIWPTLEERMVAGLPNYFLQGNMLVSLADRKNYMVVYVGPYDLLHAFKSDLRVHDHGRSCIRFKRLDLQLMDLLERIVRYTGGQLHTSKFYKEPLIAELEEELSESARISV